MVPQLEAAGLLFVGKDETGERMEVVELQDNPSGHPFYVAAQVNMIERCIYHCFKLSQPVRQGSDAWHSTMLLSQDQWLGFALYNDVSGPSLLSQCLAWSFALVL